ncbi:MAG: hypothetical protein ACREJB_14595, partial [Planctomycetaceae bacterium]
DPTLLDALNSGGGGMNALLRHSTAALLNAASPGVDYAISVPQVISLVQEAFATGDFESAKDLFESHNELGGAELADGSSSNVSTSLATAIDIVVGKLTFKNKAVSISLTNNSSTAVTIEELFFRWSSENKALTKIVINGVVVSNQRVTDDSVTVTDWMGDEDLRTLLAGETITISFVFQKRASTDVDDYDLGIDFGGDSLGMTALDSFFSSSDSLLLT